MLGFRFPSVPGILSRSLFPLVFGLVLVLTPRLLSEEREVRGRLTEKDGQSILYLWGTPEERGYAEGFLQAEAIHACFDGYFLSPRILPSPKLWDAIVLPLVRNRVQVRGRTAERVRGTIEGIRAKLPEEDRRLEKLGRELTEEDLYAAIAAVDWIGQFCSSFVASGSAVAPGCGTLVGRNLDYSSSKETARSTVVKVEAADPEAGTVAWVSFGWPGMPGCITGFSAERVSVAIHDVFARAPSSGRLTPRLDALNDLIENLRPSEDLDREAAARLRKFRVAFGANVMLAWPQKDGGGRGAVLEVDTDRKNEEGVTVRHGADADFVVCTNHHRERRPKEVCNRYDTLFEGCVLAAGKGSEPLDFDRAWHLLGKASVGLTVYRNLFDLDSGRIRFQRRRAPQGRWGPVLEFDLDELIAEGEKVAAAVSRSD